MYINHSAKVLPALECPPDAATPGGAPSCIDAHNSRHAARGSGMCAGIMTMFAPPSLLGLCYLMWERGYSSAVQRRAVQQSTATCDCRPSNL